jgi:hypothetical protein
MGIEFVMRTAIDLALYTRVLRTAVCTVVIFAVAKAKAQESIPESDPCAGVSCSACEHCEGGNCVDDSHDACHDACGNPVCSGGCDCCLPVIVSQPASQTRSSGQSATFEVTTTGGAASSYQWRKDSVNLGNGGTVSGATSPILTLISVATYDSEASYDVVVVNACGSVTSSPPATLTVLPDDDPTHYENTPPSFTVSYPPAGATIP